MQGKLVTFIKYGTVARDPALSGANDHKVELQRNPAQSSWATLAEANGGYSSGCWGGGRC